MEMTRIRQLLISALVAVSLILPAAQYGAPTVMAQDASEDAAEGEGAEEVDPYQQLQDTSEKQEGLFTVYAADGQYFVEIPTKMLGRDILWYAELGEKPVNIISDSLELSTRMVRFERRGDVIDVRDLTAPLQKRSGIPQLPKEGEQPSSDAKLDPVDLALEESSLPPIMASIPIAAESPEGDPVIEVTGIFAMDLPDFSVVPNLAASGVQATGVDPTRSYVRSVNVFPRNIHIDSFLTFLSAPEPTGGGASVSVVVHHSLTLLPDDPMTPRYYDPRVGYYDTAFQDYSGTDVNGVATKQLILRYRLEKQDPDAEISDPVKPIVYYIGPGVPDKWRSYIKQAVEDWQPVFEAAGFSNAIMAADAPSREEDSTWDPADTRFSVIRWMAQPVENAMGPNVNDPRTGEILSAHILVWADVLSLAQQWYFLQASALDPQAQVLPLPDELMGQLLRYVIGHEVGHSLGLRHNHKASQAFTIDQLRDPEFTAQYGTAPTIMSYGRFNYVAQPGDGVTSLIPRQGPYDEFAIGWGYRPIPGATSPEEELPILNEWASAGADDPWLLWGENAPNDKAAVVDPTVLTENIGADRVEATRLGIQNLERVMGYLVPATTSPGEDFTELDAMYNALLTQRLTWLSSVVKVIGGVVETRTLTGQPGEVLYERVPADEQRRAVQFLMENLRTPYIFLDPAVIDQIRPYGAAEPLTSHQKGLLRSMLTGQKYLQMLDAELFDPDNAYTLTEYLGDIQAGLFEELATDAPAIDPIRRQLQRAYVSALKDQLLTFDTEMDVGDLAQLIGIDPVGLKFLMSNGQGTDLRAAVRANLSDLRDAIAASITDTADPATRAHLEDMQTEIDNILSGEAFKYNTPATPDLGGLLGQ